MKPRDTIDLRAYTEIVDGLEPVLGKPLDAAALDAAVKALASELPEHQDLQADAAVRRHLAGVLLRRVIEQMTSPWGIVTQILLVLGVIAIGLKDWNHVGNDGESPRE